MLKKQQVELVSGTRAELIEHFRSFIFRRDDPLFLTKRVKSEYPFSCDVDIDKFTVESQINTFSEKAVNQFFHLTYTDQIVEDRTNPELPTIPLQFDRVFVQVLPNKET